jgi:hypothetical protein
MRAGKPWRGHVAPVFVAKAGLGIDPILQVDRRGMAVGPPIDRRPDAGYATLFPHVRIVARQPSLKVDVSRGT